MPGQPSGGAPGVGTGGRRLRLYVVGESNDAPLRYADAGRARPPDQNGPFGAFVGFGKQVTSDIVSGLSYSANGNSPTDATTSLLAYLRPSTKNNGPELKLHKLTRYSNLGQQ